MRKVTEPGASLLHRGDECLPGGDDRLVAGGSVVEHVLRPRGCPAEDLVLHLILELLLVRANQRHERRIEELVLADARVEDVDCARRRVFRLDDEVRVLATLFVHLPDGVVCGQGGREDWGDGCAEGLAVLLDPDESPTDVLLTAFVVP